MKRPASRSFVIGLGLVLVAVALTAPASAVEPSWHVGGPSGGTVRAVAIRPDNASTLLAGTGGAGIFRSLDGGATWAPSRVGLPVDTMVNAIVFAASAPETVYAATVNAGAFRSDDGGHSWHRVWSDSGVMDVAVDGHDHQRVVVTAGIGVYLSTDGGATWSELLHGLDRISAERVLFAPSVPNMLYVGGVSGVMRSDDDGESWLAAEVGPTNVTAMAVDPLDADRVFAATHFDGVLRSLDGGESWVPAGGGLPVVSGSPDVYLPVVSLAIDPSSRSRLYAGTTRGGYLYRSTDGGDSWSPMLLAASPHMVLALAMDPTDGRPLFAALAYDGVLRSTDRGATWSRADTHLVGSAVLSLLVRPGSAQAVVAGTLGQGVFRSTNGGVSWRRTGMAGMRVDGLSAVSSSPRLMYAAASGGLFRSTDGGASWARVGSLKARHLVEVAIAPSDPATVYTINYGGMWRTTNAGQTWRRVSWRSGLTSVTVHPHRSRIVFLGMRGGVLRSNDGAASWEAEPAGLPTYGDPRQVTVDPQRPWIVYAATEPDGFFKSRDGGRTWRPLAQQLGLPDAQAVILDPINPAIVYVGGFDGVRGGVYRSPDRGATWQPVGGKGLSTTWIASLAVATDSSRIFAGTTANGLESGGGAFWRVLP